MNYCSMNLIYMLTFNYDQFLLISVGETSRYPQLTKCTIGCYAHEFICYPIFILSLLYVCVKAMRVIYPIALLIKKLKFLSVLIVMMNDEVF